MAHLYGFPRVRIVGGLAAKRERYDVTISLPQGKYLALRELARQVVCVSFNLIVSRETQETDVLLLKAPQ